MLMSFVIISSSVFSTSTNCQHTSLNLNWECHHNVMNNRYESPKPCSQHYSDVKMVAIASQITSLTIVYSAVYPDADQRKHQSSASLAFVGGGGGGALLATQRASNAENVFIWWRHHEVSMDRYGLKSSHAGGGQHLKNKTKWPYSDVTWAARLFNHRLLDYFVNNLFGITTKKNHSSALLALW